ncbi:MAG: type II toxin-antitoxin system PemK/MazF family toxin [Saprospiraceae bacterium]|jgi:mRNA interferase MazF|nr:type II toxin-antitoxin system PemK/MazF family toxin [Saprospiraceae bacterium]MBK9567154.1 type II toxin-antitoxin system PemK/MazF family toxin [Saprospiraceae bacterium]MBP8213279.1 type II toxin-antitoxin system PemK/MazF family toxin [Saprospiraceae bacterium]
MYKQADIVVVKFPFTDGSEFKKRPVLIISNEDVNKTGDYLIIQITSNLNNDGLSIAIEDTDCLQPLPLASYIRSHKIFTIHKSLILSKITSVNPTFLKSVSDKVYSLIK